MSAFDKVIGYETIKNELLQICDMVHNKECYEALGAKLPQGILLYGDPGLGKTLIAKCFIEESGLKSYVVRRNKGNDDFISNITESYSINALSGLFVIFRIETNVDMEQFSFLNTFHPNILK